MTLPIWTRTRARERPGKNKYQHIFFMTEHRPLPTHRDHEPESAVRYFFTVQENDQQRVEWLRGGEWTLRQHGDTNPIVRVVHDEHTGQLHMEPAADHTAHAKRVQLNGSAVLQRVPIAPGDEIRAHRALVVVGQAQPWNAHAKRILGHNHFRERLYEEMARTRRHDRQACVALVILQTPGSLPTDVFREGDAIGRYAQRMLEVLLPDTTSEACEGIFMRAMARYGLGDGRMHVGIAPTAALTTDPEKLMMYARDAAERARGAGDPISVAKLHRPEAQDLICDDTSTERTVRRVEDLISRDRAILIVGERSSGKSLYAAVAHRCAGQRHLHVFSGLGMEPAHLEHRTRQRPGTVVIEDLPDMDPVRQEFLSSWMRRHPDMVVIATSLYGSQRWSERAETSAALVAHFRHSEVHVPALRHRPNDILGLAERFARGAGVQESPPFAVDALAQLYAYPWPGNVLELKNAVIRAAHLGHRRQITSAHLPLEQPPHPSEVDSTLKTHVDTVERDTIVQALDESAQNQTRAAKLLGISRRALIYKMEKYGLKEPPASVIRSASAGS